MKRSELHQVIGCLFANGEKALAKKWMQDVTESPKFEEGSLRKILVIPEGEKLTLTRINNEINKLKDKYGRNTKGTDDDKPYTKNDLELMRKLTFAKNAMKHSESTAIAGSGKYPELDKLVKPISDMCAKTINKKISTIKSKMPYKAQYVLEEVIKELQDRV